MIILFMFFILFLVGVLCLFFVLITEIKKYKESEYYKSTKFPYWKMYFDKGRRNNY